MLTSSPNGNEMNAQALESTEKGLFFIIGCGRSGTTLLQVMLDTHSEITLPNETHFFDEFYRLNHRRYGSMDTLESMEKALPHVLSTEHFRSMKLDETRIRELLAAGKPSWETLFLALLTTFRESRSSTRVGEKTPAHINYLYQLYESCPSAKFIHIIRDPKAVISSYLNAPFYKTFGRNPYHAINSWRNAMDIHREASKKLDPKRYTSVRYEDLVTQPREELVRLSAFLEVPFEEAMLEYYNRKHSGFLAAESHKMGTLKPVYKDSLENWRKHLSARNLWLIEAGLGERMREMGYATETNAGGLWSQLQLRYLFLEYKTRVRTRRLLQMAGIIKPEDMGGMAETSG